MENGSFTLKETTLVLMTHKLALLYSNLIWTFRVAGISLPSY